MRPWLWTLLTVALLGSVARAAQSPAIRWSQEVQKGIEQAQETRRPLMFWVLGRSASRDDDIERDQKRAFSDPRAVELASRFVTIRLSRSVYHKVLADWGLPRSTNLEIVFATPTGEKIDTLSPVGAADPDVLARKMTLVFRHYRDTLFEQELKAKLENPEASEAELRGALHLITDFVILSAEEVVLRLLERESLSPDVRKDVYGVLAVLSTPASVKALLDRAGADAQAAGALARCTPDGAEQMLPALGGEDPELHRIVYRAVTRICRIRDVKNDRFWRGRIESLKKKETERVRRLVTDIARRWRERYAEYR